MTWQQHAVYNLYLGAEASVIQFLADTSTGTLRQASEFMEGEHGFAVKHHASLCKIVYRTVCRTWGLLKHQLSRMQCMLGR